MQMTQHYANNMALTKPSLFPYGNIEELNMQGIINGFLLEFQLNVCYT